ncbi:MAG TPA: AI-2E family transporter [Candidatus Binatia bacterium]|jgi:predicted PurR-regulated permease PerM|nr:AI-2E family transporter [Candidatus Binatia bacterium]
MSDSTSETQKLDLGNAAALMALAISMVALAALLYYLIDLLAMFFFGIVVAAALQPGHVRLCRFGVPKGLAVLLIYLFFLVAIAFIVLFVGPMLIEELSSFAAGVPEQYATFVEWLHASPTPLLQSLGDELPPSFAVPTHNIAGLAPALFGNVIGVVTSTASFLTYLVVVLAVGFYWTMEVPRLERLILSLVTVARRPQVLNIWHEIEFKLGAFIRGQGLAMLAIGVASAIGYFLIGLPHVLALAVLAGLFEAVPLVGPLLAAVPAILVALPLGLTSVLLVIGFSVLLQVFENNILIPRIMSHAVGISALVGMFAVLALGTVYGILGIFIAIPLTVVVQVLLDRMVINPEPAPEANAVATSPLTTLRTRVQAIRQQMRLRLRGRDTRMGIDPQTPDHVADAADQHLEQVVEQVETMITAAQDDAGPMNTQQRATIVGGLQEATQHIEQAVDRVDDVTAATPDTAETREPAGELPLAALSHATQEVEQAVGCVETMVTEAQGDCDSNGMKGAAPSRKDPDQTAQIVKPF